MPDLTRAARRRCRPPLPLAVLTLALLHAQGARAQQQAEGEFDAPILLKRTPLLTETIPQALRGQLPSFVEGDRVSGRPDIETVIEGHASLRRGDTVIRADRLEYDPPSDTARATGNVYVNQAGNVYEGPQLQLKVETFEGFFNSVRYRLLVNGAEGDAERIDFIDQNRSVARRASYTTCRREDYPGWMPAWILRAAAIRTDTEENVGEAEGAQLSFFGLTTPPLPTLSFPLSNDRKTGLLPPVIGLDNVNGFEIVQPWYWNIAPNRDATITPTLMSKRGINLGTEFRYLEEGYRGEARVDYMPTDSLRSRSRWGIWTHHEQTFDAKSLNLDSLNAAININRVSDDDYWRDFTRTPSLTQRLLISDAQLNWTKGDWSGQVRALKYQTLQYELAPILPPYDRLPQVTANYNKYDWKGFDLVAEHRLHALSRRPGAAEPAQRRACVRARRDQPPVRHARRLRGPEAAAARHRLPVRRAAGGRLDARPTAWCRPSASTAAWCSSATPASSAARSARRWSRAPSTSTRRSATRASCPTTTRRSTTSISPPSTPRTSSRATTASRPPTR